MDPSKNTTDKFSIRNRLKSFTYAMAGIKTAFRSEHNMWLHLLAAVLVVLLGCYFEISQSEWLFVLLCCALVIGLEMINTAIEKLCDIVHPERHEQIQQIKDLAAGAVLIAAITAFITGLVIFLPYIYQLLRR